MTDVDLLTYMSDKNYVLVPVSVNKVSNLHNSPMTLATLISQSHTVELTNYFTFNIYSKNRFFCNTTI
jgi:hypothetical protein